MMESPTQQALDAQLALYRDQIDAMDDQIVSLLKSRTEIVHRVGALKAEHLPGRCPLRPGREATQLRRIYAAFQGSRFLPEAAIGIWRAIIGASLCVEGEFRICVYATEEHPDLYWLAKEYFGSFMTITREPGVKRIMGNVIDGKATIGVLPMLRSGASAPWWPDLSLSGHDGPKIFARMPFHEQPRPALDKHCALAIGMITPEDTGDDVSFFALETEANTSMQRLQGAMAAAGLDATWIDVLTHADGSRRHLIEFKGFITEEDRYFQSFASAMSGSIASSIFLGAYACPITIQPPASTS